LSAALSMAYGCGFAKARMITQGQLGFQTP